MNINIDLRLVSRMVFMLLIGTVVGYMMAAMVAMSDRQRDSQAEKIKEVIDKALVQCYALEGAYPADLRYLEKFGIQFEESKYVYYYEIFYEGSVQVTVIPR